MWSVALAVCATALSACAAATEPVAGAVRSAGPTVVPLSPITTAISQGAAQEAVPKAYVERDGVKLPSRELTPGADFPDVTEGDVCGLNYARSVREPRFHTKVEAFTPYGVSIHERGTYQVDHLIPIALGGSNSTTNLWPQPLAGPRGAGQKDALEDRLHVLVCAQKLTLEQAQALIATDWLKAYDRYMQRAPGPKASPSSPTATSAKEPVTNSGPCRTEGEVAYARSGHPRFTCRAGDDGQLRWRKRY